MSGTCVRRGPAPRASGRSARTWSAAGVELASPLAYKGELDIARTRGVDCRRFACTTDDVYTTAQRVPLQMLAARGPEAR